MRIGLIGDTHGSLNRALRAIDEMGPIDLLIHTGDHYRDASSIARAIKVPVHAVVGNCDPREDGPEEKVLEVEGVTIYVTHGHRNNVKVSIYGLRNRAALYKADVVVYGHTHTSGYEYITEPGPTEGVLVINPGSIKEPRDGKDPSYGILEINEGVVSPGIYHIRP